MNHKLREWQDRYTTAQTAYNDEIAKMDGRERLYKGDGEIKKIIVGDRITKTPLVRNICSELVEAQVNSNIPQPKVTAIREEDELKAKLIEDMLRNELDRLPMEYINDMAERTVPIQGGSAWLVEWDNTERTHSTIGELIISGLHPRQIIPQDGVYSGIEDMDYIFIALPQTKAYIERRYKVSVGDESESEPEIKSFESEEASSDMVTQIVAYYRNDNGGIGLYSWVNDVELEDIEDYQARRLRRCKKCGAVEPNEIEAYEEATEDGTPPDGEKKPHRRGAKMCPYCGSTKWEDSTEEYEEIYTPITLSNGNVIPGATMQEKQTADEFGNIITEAVAVPTKIPFYKPDIYPVVLQKNVSVYGRFLGDSDVDKIASHQNAINRVEAKIIEKLLKAGSYITLPDEASIRVDTEDMKVIRPGNAASKSMIDVYTLEGEISQDMAYLAQIYEEARQAIGITDSYQGRVDRTATSGKAKEFSAAQAAGRLESKRMMKDAAYAALFEAMFKFKLAYADEPRPVHSKDNRGNTKYSEFNRYDFLEQDENGEWFWNDQFLFSCDNTAPLASNREAMWQETRMNLQTGAFGDPNSIDTLILFWTKMELLHYPGASDTKTYLEEQKQIQMQMQQQQMMMARQQEEAMVAEAINRARQDAYNNAKQPIYR